jgi:hypothetical protein
MDAGQRSANSLQRLATYRLLSAGLVERAANGTAAVVYHLRTFHRRFHIRWIAPTDATWDDRAMAERRQQPFNWKRPFLVIMALLLVFFTAFLYGLKTRNNAAIELGGSAVTIAMIAAIAVGGFGQIFAGQDQHCASPLPKHEWATISTIGALDAYPGRSSMG